MPEYRCVRCGADVDFVLSGAETRCPACAASFPIVDGRIPVFLDDPATAANYYGRMFRDDAARYDDTYNVHGAHGLWVLQRLVEMELGVKALAGGTLLEIGAGTGQLTRALAGGELLPYRRLYVSDLSPEMLSVNWSHRNDAEKDLPSRYISCNVLKLPLPDASVDVAMGIDILHHILDYSKALHEVRRVLRPGGVCVLLEPHREAFHLLSFLMRILVRMDRSWRPFHGLTRQDRQRLLGWQAHILNAIALEDRGDHAALAVFDDKYLFDPKKLAEHAKAAGFSRFSECNILSRPELNVPYGPMIRQNFKGLGLSARGLAWVDESLADLDATIGPHMLATAPINTLFLFWR